MSLQLIKQTTATITQNLANELYKFNLTLAKLTRTNRHTEALKLFTKLHLKPDHYTLSTTLTSSAHLHNKHFTSQLHALSIKSDLIAFSHVSNSLLSAYAKTDVLRCVQRAFEDIERPDAYSWTTVLSACVKGGEVGYACKVFGEMPKGNVAGWNAMITGFAENGDWESAVGLFRRMHGEGVGFDGYSFASVLSLCGEVEVGLGALGRQVFGLVVKTGFLVRVSVVNAFITMCFSCRSVEESWLLLEEAEVQDEVTFNVMIEGLGSVRRDEEALMLFRDMQRVGFWPTELTFVSVMSLRLDDRVGRQIQSQAIKMGYEEFTSVCNAAITMYSSFGDVHAACMVFKGLEMKDIVSWNSMISCYAQADCGRDAFLTYEGMQRAGIKADEFTYGSLLASAGSSEVVEMIHALVCVTGIISTIQVSNALVSAYAKYGMLEPAYEIFHAMPVKNLISWNTIISGLLLNGLLMHGLELFSELLKSELQPNGYTLSIALSICSSTSSSRHGKEIHCYILRYGHSQEISLGNALVTMYARCGVLDWSLKVFNGMIQRDTITWNALISAYAQHGRGKEAVHCFDTMLDKGVVEPDQATFTAVLSACSHSGLVDDGSRIFNSMLNDYGFIPGEEQFSCMVDLLGRAGYLEEARRVINTQQVAAKSNIWWTLFSACAAHGNLRLGRIVAGLLLEKEQNNPSVHVLLSNIYAAAGQWEEATKIREMSKRIGVTKQPGCSWIGS